eukprot:663139_1
MAPSELFVSGLHLQKKAFIFRALYPGFGGFLPWFTVNYNQTHDYHFIAPVDGWTHQTPALDNGQLYWSLYGIKWALLQHHNAIINDQNNHFNINTTLHLIQSQLSTMEKWAKTIFYAG